MCVCVCVCACVCSYLRAVCMHVCINIHILYIYAGGKAYGQLKDEQLKSLGEINEVHTYNKMHRGVGR